MRIILFLLSVFMPLAAWAYPAEIAEVFDGDTVLTTKGEHIRLVNINSPEVAHENKLAEPYGDAARTYLTGRVKGKKVEVTPAKKKLDKYKRTLADVKLDGKSLNMEMVSVGLAHVYTFPDNSEDVKALLDAENKARAAHKGLWADKRWQVTPASGVVPDDWIGQYRLVEGKVKNVVQVKDRIYLNFGDNWRDDFTVEIPQKFIRKFAAQQIDPTTFYRNKTLRVRGVLKPVNGVLVTATHPAQLEVLP